MLKISFLLFLLVLQPWQNADASEESGVKQEEKRQTHCTHIKKADWQWWVPMSPNKIPIKPDCGQNKFGTREAVKNEFIKRIVGGHVSAEGQWPWMVTYGTAQHGHFCGGTLLSDRWILTAAHCFDNLPSPCMAFIIQVGENTLVGHSWDRQTHAVDQVIIHQNYGGPPNFPNDIALMRLKTRVNLAEIDANVICLPSILDTYLYSSCTVTGWGKTIAGSQGDSSNVLKHLQIGQLPNPDCQLKLGARKWLLPGQVCINSYSGRDACQGDSGGPMVCKTATGKWIQIGVTSHGSHASGQCALNTPSIYTDVWFFMNWIEGEIAKNGGA